MSTDPDQRRKAIPEQIFSTTRTATPRQETVGAREQASDGKEGDEVPAFPLQGVYLLTKSLITQKSLRLGLPDRALASDVLSPLRESRREIPERTRFVGSGLTTGDVRQERSRLAKPSESLVDQESAMISAPLSRADGTARV